MVKVSNKNTKRKCEISPGRNYSQKNVWGGFHGAKFSEEGLLSRGELFRRNCSGVVVFGGIIKGLLSGGQKFWG